MFYWPQVNINQHAFLKYNHIPRLATECHFLLFCFTVEKHVFLMLFSWWLNMKTMFISWLFSLWTLTVFLVEGQNHTRCTNPQTLATASIQRLHHPGMYSVCSDLPAFPWKSWSCNSGRQVGGRAVIHTAPAKWSRPPHIITRIGVTALEDTTEIVLNHLGN